MQFKRLLHINQNDKNIFKLPFVPDKNRSSPFPTEFPKVHMTAAVPPQALPHWLIDQNSAYWYLDRVVSKGRL